MNKKNILEQYIGKDKLNFYVANYFGNDKNSGYRDFLTKSLSLLVHLLIPTEDSDFFADRVRQVVLDYYITMYFNYPNDTPTDRCRYIIALLDIEFEVYDIHKNYRKLAESEIASKDAKWRELNSY
jgi:hypothetical protein